MAFFPENWMMFEFTTALFLIMKLMHSTITSFLHSGGYTNTPSVSFVGGTGHGATAVATIVNGQVTEITITNPGIGYSALATIVIDPPRFPSSPATGSVDIVNGFVRATLTDGGHGYGLTAPPVHILGGGGTGAKAVATVVNGVVTTITVTNPGSGYTSLPRLRASPR